MGTTASLTDGELLLQAERRRLEAEHRKGASGRQIARAHADAVDAALRMMLSPQGDRRGWALVATADANSAPAPTSI